MVMLTVTTTVLTRSYRGNSGRWTTSVVRENWGEGLRTAATLIPTRLRAGLSPVELSDRGGIVISSPPFRFKRRNYLHFDYPVSESDARNLACDPLEVATHSFYPFLGYKIVTRRIGKDGRRLIFELNDRTAFSFVSLLNARTRVGV